MLDNPNPLPPNWQTTYQEVRDRWAGLYFVGILGQSVTERAEAAQTDVPFLIDLVAAMREPAYIGQVLGCLMDVDTAPLAPALRDRLAHEILAALDQPTTQAIAGVLETVGREHGPVALVHVICQALLFARAYRQTDPANPLAAQWEALRAQYPADFRRPFYEAGHRANPRASEPE